MADPSDSFVACTSRWRCALLAVGSSAFVVAGLWMVGAFGNAPTPTIQYPHLVILSAGWMGLIMGPLAVIKWISKLFGTAEQLRIDEAGIRYAPWSDKTVPWSEIADVTTWSRNGLKRIVLHLRHPNNFPGKGLAARLASNLTGGNVSITILLTGTDRNYYEAMSAIERYRQPSQLPVSPLATQSVEKRAG
ncbi:hypothetical protein FJ987_13855 [Mesorhizobium sp. CU2]|uniref:STM3941 family protein n=1 Tax=unclassified Mesorhizobium TaxID=325217 RepID=UPI00112BCA54|nr:MULTISPECIES: STM3941 family protein [unclassified Mesorhizobium]TPN74538.1 hypothetical protein FJ988_30405 [Mesorhizobium sp. CU3]TPO14616.1 hypothetical protein FJ987_13855 [Mesorhizobium sp. CU2]